MKTASHGQATAGRGEACIVSSLWTRKNDQTHLLLSAWGWSQLEGIGVVLALLFRKT